MTACLHKMSPFGHMPTGRSDWTLAEVLWVAARCCPVDAQLTNCGLSVALDYGTVFEVVQSSCFSGLRANNCA